VIAPVELVLFDLGGVLVEVGGVARMKELAGIERDEELWQRWLACRWVRTFERGECTPDDFAAGVVEDWALPIEPSAFIAAFQAWIDAPFAGAGALVQEVRAVTAVGCLSNTNALHYDEYFSRWWVDTFDYEFLSFQLGAVKPDRDLFDRVAERLPTTRDRVLFLDDNAINVHGAIDAGFTAVQVRGIDEARAALVAAGVVPR
jgi:FMN phosphatase YigB (HAD superfamily)